MKILCLTTHDLDAPDYGASLRARNVFKLLSRVGDVNVLLAGDFPNETAKTKNTIGEFPLLDAFQFQPTGKWSPSERLRNEFDGRFLNTDSMLARTEDRERLQQFIAAHDLVWIHTLKVANRFGLWRWPRTVLDIDDVPSDLYATYPAAQNAVEKIRNRRQYVLWRRREKLLPERFDALCVCSESDRAKLGGQENVFVLPNGFSAPEKTPARHPAEPPQIGFVGMFNYAPNRDGIRWFVEKIWPLILKNCPQARLRLAGDGTEKFSGGQNVDSLGWVADMESEMANWSLTVVPLLAGGGTRIKILEAFSRKCPVVSTNLGAYGHDVEDGRELLVADSPKTFAEDCLRILENPFEGERLADAAWETFLKDCTWDSQAGRVTEIVEKVLSGNRTTSQLQNIPQKKDVFAAALQISRQSKIN